MKSLMAPARTYHSHLPLDQLEDSHACEYCIRIRRAVLRAALLTSSRGQFPLLDSSVARERNSHRQNRQNNVDEVRGSDCVDPSTLEQLGFEMAYKDIRRRRQTSVSSCSRLADTRFFIRSSHPNILIIRSCSRE